MLDYECEICPEVTAAEMDRECRVGCACPLPRPIHVMRLVRCTGGRLESHTLQSQRCLVTSFEIEGCGLRDYIDWDWRSSAGKKKILLKLGGFGQHKVGSCVEVVLGCRVLL